MLMIYMNDSGGSASSNVNFVTDARACVTSCSFGFQDFPSLSVQNAAVKDHILEKVGCTARLKGIVRAFDDRDLLLHIPAALLDDGFSALVLSRQ